jgi:uncharacterized protein (TIGR02757 family)
LPGKSRKVLERAYRRFHRRESLVGDPWEYPAGFSKPRDVECAAFVASALAYGSKKAIARSLATVAAVIGASPSEYAARSATGKPPGIYRLPQHRWTTPRDLASLLQALGILYGNGSSLVAFFGRSSVEHSLNCLSDFLRSRGVSGYLVPAPKDGSACKRPLMFLRWMVRDDGLDFGIWKNALHPRDLIIPLDVHSYRAAFALGLTRRRCVNWKTALEVTEGLKAIDPDDPVRFDFALHNLSYHSTNTTRASFSALSPTRRG